MVTSATKPSRKQQILESLAFMLEENKGARITTAALAAEVGVSEAALYRHFPSKARMFEELIEFVEESIFSRINIIVSQSTAEDDRVGQIINLVITFASRNPGISRILTGEALTGEQLRLRARITQLFNRLEVQLKQVIREKAVAERKQNFDASIIANILLNIIDGRLQQFVRSDFKRSPLENWDKQINSISRAMEYVSHFNSPWFQLYADIGNLAYAGLDVVSQLEIGRGHIAALHVKDTQRGQLRYVAPGEGIVPFVQSFAALAQMGFQAPVVLELWTEDFPDAVEIVGEARDWLRVQMEAGFCEQLTENSKQ